MKTTSNWLSNRFCTDFTNESYGIRKKVMKIKNTVDGAYFRCYYNIIK